MAIHSSILAWRINGRGVWWAIVCGGGKELDTNERVTLHANLYKGLEHPRFRYPWGSWNKSLMGTEGYI